MTPEDNQPVLKPADLRGILRYVPLFRGHCFVVALDGGVVWHENLPHVLTDLAVLRSLSINVILVHGIGEPLRALAAERDVTLSDDTGTNPTDAATLVQAQDATDRVQRVLWAGLHQLGLRVARVNALRAEPRGIIGGQDQQWTGRVMRADVAQIRQLLAEDTIPLFGPIQWTRDGTALRLNSDELAAELAIRLGASKLIYLTCEAGLMIDGHPVLNLPVAELEARLTADPGSFLPVQLPKAQEAIRALRGGTDRAHLLDGRQFGALLTEIFDKVGLGTMIHADAYQQIRQAEPGDVPALQAILRAASRTEALRAREQASLERDCGQFFVYQIDGGIIACASLVPLEPGVTAELASVLVLPAYQGKGVGKTMTAFAIDQARAQGYATLFALTTQAKGFFEAVGFRATPATDLPATRQAELATSGRRSHVFRLDLTQGGAR